MIYPKSIEVYHDACDEILSWMYDWLDQDDFDRLSMSLNPYGKKIVAFTDETILLPLYGDSNLGLLQEMVRRKIVQTKLEKGKIFYRKKGKRK